MSSSSAARNSTRRRLGTTERTRYVKVTTLEEAQAPTMRNRIEQAGRVRSWQWVWGPRPAIVASHVRITPGSASRSRRS
jgi:hypothetical protein